MPALALLAMSVHICSHTTSCVYTKVGAVQPSVTSTRTL